MGDMILVDAHIEVNAYLSVEDGHDIGLAARHAVMQRHRVLNLLTHIDPVPSRTDPHTTANAAAIAASHGAAVSADMTRQHPANHQET
jgi:divalent metal cation (Fe/Co/Zn/Cd) transporter